MFDLTVNILGVIKNNLPRFLWVGWNIHIFRVYTKPFRMIYVEFKAAKDDLIYKARHNGTMISLQTALNDKFDSVNRGITLTNAFFTETYIYRKSESKPAIIAYRRWNTTSNFITGKFCWYLGLVYVSNTT